jgi:UDP-N-acetylmuramoyl-tripeptide--D-alanyl-D-alanine ligase
VATGVVIDSRRVTRAISSSRSVRGALRAAARPGAAAALAPETSRRCTGGALRSRAPPRGGDHYPTGKTSTKDILAAICTPHARTVAAEASYNNELGVPLTLCRLEEDTEICILELAMRGLGQIAELAAVARPDVGVITNVGPAHVELVGSVEAVGQAKGELVEALPSGGTAIVPADFPVERDDLDVVRVGEPEVRFEDGRAVVSFGGREIAFTFRARHQARNAFVALHAARALGIEAADAVEVEFSRWRGEEAALPGGGLLINDAYNANPTSMRAALEHLADCAEGRRMVAVLGEMAELGPGAPEYHREVGRHVDELGIDVLVAVGPLARHYLETAGTVPETAWATTAIEAADVARDLLRPGDCVLVKASRAVGLETVAGALTGEAIQSFIQPRCCAAAPSPESSRSSFPASRAAAHRLPPPPRLRAAHPRGGPQHHFGEAGTPPAGSCPRRLAVAFSVSR